jgi:hypothetical protein
MTELRTRLVTERVRVVTLRLKQTRPSSMPTTDMKSAGMNEIDSTTMSGSVPSKLWWCQLGRGRAPLGLLEAQDFLLRSQPIIRCVSSPTATSLIQLICPLADLLFDFGIG